ncbi:unnamed protein product [Nyctereutes procyonoides]|uniref:(raccoon dog) hypothetical protein n=1 Tax=Nyctereutes procyonoides TaxID=34880 RepID=A0A811YCK9_NYCPR|nr:unnamed protein product [Nyctereutes procyonoides]
MALCYGYCSDYHEKKRKTDHQEAHEDSKKTIKMHEKRHTKQKNDGKTPQGAVPAYLLDREGHIKIYSNRKEKEESMERIVTKACCVGDGFTQKPPKYKRFIRTMSSCVKKTHVTHPELRATFWGASVLSICQVTIRGVITKGIVLEVNTSELGLATQGGKVIWGKIWQVTNNPENDGCMTVVLLL